MQVLPSRHELGAVGRSLGTMLLDNAARFGSAAAFAERVQAHPAAEQTFFHPELRFVFTAAAPLPLSTSNVFRDHGVPVVEGWGLTETSPGVTLTERTLERSPGVVGWPMAGIEVALAEDGEILVRGPNVMSGSFRNEEATRAVFTADGWFRTSDVGEFGPEGVRILSRKERMFKLGNGGKVFLAQIEQRPQGRCQFVKYAYVFGSGLRAACRYRQPRALQDAPYDSLPADVLPLALGERP